MDDEIVYVSFLVASLNAPVYVSVPVEDPAVVDRFLDHLDELLAEMAARPERGGWFDLDFDFYRVPLGDDDHLSRCYNVQFGPVKWRLFFARIGDGLYVASKRFILEDLYAAGNRPVEAQPVDRGPNLSSTPRNPNLLLLNELRARDSGVAPGAVVGGRVDWHGYGASICCTLGGSATPVAANTLPQVPWDSLRNKKRLPSCSTSAYCRLTRSRITSSHSSL